MFIELRVFKINVSALRKSVLMFFCIPKSVRLFSAHELVQDMLFSNIF
jgi:hypothetical protein